jgi:hypothetical protein
VTEALKQWAMVLSNKHWDDTKLGPIDPINAEFWLRAFVAEVEKRATFNGHTHDKECFNECFGDAFTEVTSKLLGNGCK